MPAFLAPLIGVAARVAGPAIARAVGPAALRGASRVVGPAVSAGAKRALPMLGKVAKSPITRGAMIGHALTKGMGGGQSSSRQENFDNWFPGQGNNGAMY